MSPLAEGWEYNLTKYQRQLHDHESDVHKMFEETLDVLCELENFELESLNMSVLIVGWIT